jgi:hypothetical protein
MLENATRPRMKILKAEHKSTGNRKNSRKTVSAGCIMPKLHSKADIIADFSGAGST